MNSIAEISRLLENLVRLGTIAEVQHAPPRVKVRTGGILTTWLPCSPRELVPTGIGIRPQ